jgi:LacI family transcriptional regulator
MLPTEPGRVGPPVFLEMLAACALRLGEAGLDLLLVPASRSDEMETFRRLVDGGRADAMIVVRTRRDDERVAYLVQRGIPFVAHGRTFMQDDHAFIDGDSEAGFREATHLLASLGHERIAHLAAPLEFTFAHLRRSGWLKGLTERNLPMGPEAVAQPTERGGYDAALSILARSPRPTAFLCATDSIAIGALRALREAGLEAGRDIALIGHDNLPSAAFTDPPLTTMEIAAPDIGRELADLLIAHLGGRNPRELQKLLPVRQILRATHALPN